MRNFLTVRISLPIRIRFQTIRRKPFVTSGIRLGTPAATSRGLKEDDFDQVAEAIAMLIKEGEPAVEKAKAIIKTLTDKYPLQPMH